jgi:hypothetical protein
VTMSLFIPQVIYEYEEPWWNDIDRGNRRTLRKTCQSSILSTTKPTWTDKDANLGLHGEKSVTNCLSCGTPYLPIWWSRF